MAGLVPAIHAFPWIGKLKTWMPATSAGMTSQIFQIALRAARIGYGLITVRARSTSSRGVA